MTADQIRQQSYDVLKNIRNWYHRLPLGTYYLPVRYWINIANPYAGSLEAYELISIIKNRRGLAFLLANALEQKVVEAGALTVDQHICIMTTLEDDLQS